MRHRGAGYRFNSEIYRPQPVRGEIAEYHACHVRLTRRLGEDTVVDLSFSMHIFLAGILRGSDGTLWDFLGFLMAVSAH